MMQSLLQDIRYGLRMLGKNPGFTAIAVLTLTLGIGANTALFSIIHAVLLRPLPLPEPDRVVEIARAYRGAMEMTNFSAREFDFWKGHREPFEFLAASTGQGFNLVSGDTPERVRALRVSSEYFRVLGLQPAIGRDFRSEEDQPGGPRVAILSNALWSRRFASDQGAIGRVILLNGEPHAVIGVMPPVAETVSPGVIGFTAPAAGTASPVDVWVPIAPVAATVGGGQNFEVLGRLKSGETREHAQAYLKVAGGQLLREEFRNRSPEGISFAVFPYLRVLTSDVRAPLLILFGAIGFVLLIACANVANLMMARATARRREMAIRTALGASAGRLVRQLLTESLLLSACGGALGLVLAYASLHPLLALTPVGLPRAAEAGLDGSVLGFTLLISFGAGILFGLAPAWQTTRSKLKEGLNEAGRTGASGFHRGRVRSALLVSQFALAVVLLVGSGLLMQAFFRLIATDPGFDPHHILSIEIWPDFSRLNSTEGVSALDETIVQRLESLPGVGSAAVVSAGLPLERGGNNDFEIESRNPPVRLSADYREITPDYFRTLGARLLQGRFFTQGDRKGALPVAIINEAFARGYSPGASPLGQHFRQRFPENVRLEIVGVVTDAKSFPNEEAPPTVFIPSAQASIETTRLFSTWFPVHILVRTAGKPESISTAVASVLREIAPEMPAGRTRTMDQVLGTSVTFNRFTMVLMSLFAGLALVLAAVGVYGVMAHLVGQRTREIGIRMALGAQRGDVLQMVIGEGIVLAGAGVVIGIGGALVLTRLLRSMLFEIKPSDPATYAGGVVLLMGVALAACYVPARRAMKVEPMVALRYE